MPVFGLFWLGPCFYLRNIFAPSTGSLRANLGHAQKGLPVKNKKAPGCRIDSISKNWNYIKQRFNGIIWGHKK